MNSRHSALQPILLKDEITILASAARTATVNSADFTNRWARGLIVTLDVTAVTATPSITLSIAYKDPASGKYETLFTATAAVTATGTHSYLLYPGAAAAANDVTESLGFPLPTTWRVTVTHADTDSITYSVGGSYLA